MKEYTHDTLKVIEFPVSPFYKGFLFHVYLIDDLMIDTGPYLRRRKLKKLYSQLEVNQVVLTHYHQDHIGMSAWLARDKQAKIYAHELSKNYFLKKDDLPFFLKPIARRIFNFNYQVIPEEIKTKNHRFIPIHTPGHTRDHIALYEANKKWLFTGDLYITAYPIVANEAESIADYIKSLKKLMTYDFETVFCAHEGIVLNAREKIQEKITYLEWMRQRVRSFHLEGYSDEEIVKLLFPRRARLEKMSLGFFSRKKFVQSCYK